MAVCCSFKFKSIVLQDFKIDSSQIAVVLLGCIDPDLHGRDQDKHHIVLPAVACTQHPLEGRNIRGR